MRSIGVGMLLLLLTACASNERNVWSSLNYSTTYQPYEESSFSEDTEEFQYSEGRGTGQLYGY